ncbi:hypothetical protein HDU96_001546 [Phlyctochytrium bullatum]|nr:hypothetical protein HDU96_001546 [Phlyctochytrium bullatum]
MAPSASSTRPSTATAAPAAAAAVPLPPAMFKGKKARKSLSALILASATAASTGFPHFVHTIHTLRPLSKPDRFPRPNASAAVAAASTASGRRAFSTATVPHHPQDLAGLTPAASRQPNAVSSAPASTSHLQQGSSSASSAASSAAAPHGLASRFARGPPQSGPTSARSSTAGLPPPVPAPAAAAAPVEPATPAAPNPRVSPPPTPAAAAATTDDDDDEDWDAEFNIDTTPPTPSSRLSLTPAPTSGLPSSATGSATTLSSHLHATPPPPLRASAGVPRPSLGGLAGDAAAAAAAPITRRTPTTAAATAALSRRIQSAPSVALRRLGDGGGGGMVDALLEDASTASPLDPGAFLSAEVREKAERRRLKELERSVSAEAGLESWDDDFEYAGRGREAGGGVGVAAREEWLSVPRSVCEAQEALRTDAENMKGFALHIEDLKLFYHRAQDLAQHLAKSAPTSRDPPTLLRRLDGVVRAFAADLDQCQVLIDLGEYDEDGAATTPIPAAGGERHLRILAEMLTGGDAAGAGPGARKGTGVGHLVGGRKEGSEVTVREAGRLEFGVGLIPMLIRRMGPLKQRLGRMVEEMGVLAEGAGVRVGGA